MPQSRIESLLRRSGVARPGARGRRRVLVLDELVLLGAAIELCDRIGTGERDAMRLAAALLGSADGSLALGDALVVRCDRAAIERRLRERLPFALEVVVVPRRGRPPRRPSGRA